MASTLDGKLVVAISSRALFDFEEENLVFEQSDDRAYMDLQLQRLETPAKPGVAFSLVKKLLSFNQADASRVEVVILSRNDPVSGMRVFRSAQHYGLDIQRGSFTRGQPPWRYLKPLNANLFLSTHLSDVRAALDAGVPAAQVYPHSAHASEAHPHEVRGIVQRRSRAGVPVARLECFSAAREGQSLATLVCWAFQAALGGFAPPANRGHAAHGHSHRAGDRPQCASA